MAAGANQSRFDVVDQLGFPQGIRVFGALLAPDLTRDEAVELVLWPSLGKERSGQDDHPEAATGQAGVDLAAEAIANPKLEVIEPDCQARSRRCSVSGRATAALSSLAWETKTSHTWCSPLMPRSGGAS